MTHKDFWLPEKATMDDIVTAYYLHCDAERKENKFPRAFATLFELAQENGAVDFSRIGNLWLFYHCLKGEPADNFYSNAELAKIGGYNKYQNTIHDFPFYKTYISSNNYWKFYYVEWDVSAIMQENIKRYKESFVKRDLKTSAKKYRDKRVQEDWWYVFGRIKATFSHESDNEPISKNKEIIKLKDDKNKLLDLQMKTKIPVKTLLSLYEWNKNLFYRLHYMAVNKNPWLQKYLDFVTKNF